MNLAQQQADLQAWTESRAKAQQIMAEHGKRADWETWARAEVEAFQHSAMLAKILSANAIALSIFA